MTEIRYNTKRLGMNKGAGVRRRKKPMRQSSDESGTESEQIYGSSEDSDHEKFD